jgi:hypothetical protein
MALVVRTGRDCRYCLQATEVTSNVWLDLYIECDNSARLAHVALYLYHVSLQLRIR